MKKVFISLFLLASWGVASNIVETNGKLVRCGNKICGAKIGEPVQVKGPSFYWSTPSWGGHVFFREETVNAMVDGWKATLIRAPLGVTPDKAEEGEANGWGYEDRPEENWPLVKTVIDAAKTKGVYVIADWHSHYAHEQEALAIDYFTNNSKAGQYCNDDHVIYEIYNEPLEDGTAAWAKIKTYSENVIAAIRNKGCENLILVGTPYYSSEVNIASEDPPHDEKDNFALVFHFYADAHKIDGQAWPNKNGATYGDLVQTALDNDIPVFVSEWGTNDAHYSNPNIAESNKWQTFLNNNKISWAAWSVYVGGALSFWEINPLAFDIVYGEKLSHWTNPNCMTVNGRYIYGLLTGNSTAVTGECAVGWFGYEGNSSAINTQWGYWAWAGGTSTMQSIENGGGFTFQLGSDNYAGLGTGGSPLRLENCLYGIGYSYKGAPHDFYIQESAPDGQPKNLEFTSVRLVTERADDWKSVNHKWSYFLGYNTDNNSSIDLFGWRILAEKANKPQDFLHIKDIVCLEDPNGGTLSIRTPQIANGNIQVYSAGKNIMLANVPVNAKIEVYNLSGKLISSKSFNQVNQGSDMLRIPVQTKGIYLIRVNAQTLRVAVF